MGAIHEIERRLRTGTGFARATGVLDIQLPLLERASEIAGDREALAEYLGVSMARLKVWLAGTVRLPDPIFLRTVDLLLRDDVARASCDRRKRLRDHPNPALEPTESRLGR